MNFPALRQEYPSVKKAVSIWGRPFYYRAGADFLAFDTKYSIYV